MNYKNAIRVIVPRDLHIGNELFENVTIGDIIRVEIKKSRFQINDESILSVGIFLENTNKKVLDAESDIKQQSSNISEDEP